MYEIIEIYEINSEIFKNIENNIEKFIDRNLFPTCFQSEYEKSSKLFYEQSLKESDVSFQKNKKVKFSNIKYIYLIPYYYEIIKSLDDIWWNGNDLLNASHDAAKKIKDLLDIHPLMTLKQAKKILYSPFSYDESNF